MNNVWFFIANPKKYNDWKESKNWDKHKGQFNWGIPTKNRDIENLKRVKEGNIILCYQTHNGGLVGWCRCTHQVYPANMKKENVNPEFINRIGISEIGGTEEPFTKFKKPIKLDKLKQMELRFIEEYLDFPRGRSIVKVPNDDWIKLRDEFGDVFGKSK